jgi:hypothetical protein
MAVTYQCAKGGTDGYGYHHPITGSQKAHEHRGQAPHERSPKSVPGRDGGHGEETQNHQGAS